MSALERAAALGVAALATARLTRFFTSDKLGEWLIVGRVKRWAARREVPADLAADLERRFEEEVSQGRAVASPPARWGWRSKLVSGLDCAACIGFWLGALVLLGEVIVKTRAFRWVRPIWRFALGAFALNYVVFHVSSRIDG